MLKLFSITLTVRDETISVFFTLRSASLHYDLWTIPSGRLSVESDEVVLRRTVGHKKDEFFLNRKRIQKSEVQSLLESAGFSKSNPYYIVQQGKVWQIDESYFTMIIINWSLITPTLHEGCESLCHEGSRPIESFEGGSWHHCVRREALWVHQNHAGDI